MAEVQRHRQFVEWMDAIVDPASVEFLGPDCWMIRQEIDALIEMLEASDEPLEMPYGSRLDGGRYDLYQLRWPSLPSGLGPRAASGAVVIRVLYGYARPASDPSLCDVAVILLGGDKAPMPDTWYRAVRPEAERRLTEWCHEHLAFVPR